MPVTPGAAHHLLQLFDTEESLTHTVARFLEEGVAHGETLLVVATGDHWRQVEALLRERGANTAALMETRRLVVLDAEQLLATFVRRGRVLVSLFRHHVGTLVAGLRAQSPAGVRVFGEMVELLARDGNYEAAAELEKFWNDLLCEEPCTLLCGYAAAHFAGPDAGSVLPDICAQHSATVTHASDPLAHFLISRHERRGRE